jgi:ATP-binding cassette, subfamily B (MDR/TAP), member 1
MNIFARKYQTQILDLYSKAGSIAEETFAAIRTVTAFGAQGKMSARYAEKLGVARDAGIRKSVSTGVGLGSMFGFIYLAYSLAFYYGSILLSDNQITAGKII